VRFQNHSSSMVVIDTYTGQEFSGNGDDILKRLTPFHVDAWLQHNTDSIRTPGVYPLVAGLASIPPCTAWDIGDSEYQFIEDLTIANHNIGESCDVADCIAGFGVAIHQYQWKRIAVELSGGLDSSLVIELLRANGVDPVLIGYSSESYEFRTERKIQEYYAANSDRTHLLTYENNPSFSSLNDVPFHPFPTTSSHFFARHRTTANLALSLGVDVVLSGEAGDQVLGAPFEHYRIGSTIPTGCEYWNLSELWTDQFVYKPLGVRYISALAIPEVTALLLSLRGTGTADPQKLWARRKFAHVLPSMLSQFAYCSFHDGWVCNGLKLNMSTIATLADRADEVVRHPALDRHLIVSQAYSFGAASESVRRRFLLALSFVVWVESLKRALL
jgi:hypothetical protein